MVLKTYEEMDKHYKEIFYDWWYGKNGKRNTIDYIENNLPDVDDFLIEYHGMNFSPSTNIRIFKFLRSELWDMGINCTKGIGSKIYFSKRKKEDKYSQFLTYYDKNLSLFNTISVFDEVRDIQIITGKSLEEAKRILVAAWDSKTPYDISPESKDERNKTKDKAKDKTNDSVKSKDKAKNNSKRKTIKPIDKSTKEVDDTDNSKEVEASDFDGNQDPSIVESDTKEVHNYDVTEVLEQTLADDDSE